jgi:hypothetical protein
MIGRRGEFVRGVVMEGRILGRLALAGRSAPVEVLDHNGLAVEVRLLRRTWFPAEERWYEAGFTAMVPARLVELDEPVA